MCAALSATSLCKLSCINAITLGQNEKYVSGKAMHCKCNCTRRTNQCCWKRAQRATQGILVLPKCLRLEHYTLKKVETTFLCVLFEYGCLSFQSNVFAKEIFANASKLIFVTNVVIFFFSSRSTKFP